MTGKLPDFIIVGFQKCGTTSLALNLAKHPEIYMTEFVEDTSKEVHFFDRDHKYFNGIDSYKAKFPEVDKVCGEKTPDYIESSVALNRIKKSVPGVKLIVCVRNPVSRLMSQVNMRWKNGHLITVQEALVNPEYFGRGLYYDRINDLQIMFGKENVHIVIHEEDPIRPEALRDDPKVSGMVGDDNQGYNDPKLKEVFKFLGVTDIKVDSGFHFVAKEYTYDFSDEEIQSMKDFYRGHNEKFFSLIGQTIESW